VSGQESEPADGEAAREPFIQRWSRLKSESRSARRDEPPDAAVPPAGSRPVTAQDDATTRPKPPALPDLEQLDQDSDYSAFLLPDVDSALRRQALRKLFHSPKFNVCDGLDDYCDDFTQFAPLGNLVTADMRHQVERAARRVLAPGSTAPAEEPPRLAHQPATEEAAPDADEPAAKPGEEQDDVDHGPA